MHGRTLDPCPVPTPHSLDTLLYPIFIWRRKWILSHQRSCVPRGGDWAPGIGDQGGFFPSSSPPLPVRPGSSPVSSVFTCHLLRCQWSQHDFEHLNFLFRTLKMEVQRKGKSREQNKKTWEGKGAEGNSCYWQAKQHDSVSFKLVFSLNKVGPSLFQVHP